MSPISNSNPNPNRMQASTLSDEEKTQFLNEFRDPTTTEFRRVVVAKRLAEDIARKKCPKLIARARDGEQLSDRELSLLIFSYNGEIDENIQKQIYERNLSQLTSERFVSEYFNERIKKQLALSIIKEGATKVIAESAVRTAVQAATKSGLTLASPFFDVPKSFWTINLAVGGCMMLVDLAHSLWLLWNGKITGKALIKRMTSSLISTVSSLGLSSVGGTIGAMIGAVLGPFGLYAGSLVGGLLGALFGKFVNDKIWEYFDGNEEEKAREALLSGAREVLGVMKSDDFKTITQRYYRMALETHPDKHPNADDEEKERLNKKFYEVHTSYNILREEIKRQGKLPQDEIEKISKSTAIRVMNDGWCDSDDD